MNETENDVWFRDFLSPDESHSHKVRKVLLSVQTPYQQMEIVETGSYGRCLVLDGKMQSSEADEFIYHEALVHPALLTHPDPRRVFVVGGGEGATVREILRHRSVEHVTMVDIDQEVVERCREHLPEWHQGAFDDPRVKLAHVDARKFLAESDATYDVIVIDISEPVEEGPAYLLYTREFYRLVNRRLTPDGIITLQAGTTAVHGLLCLASVYQTLKTAFPTVAVYQTSVPSFGLPWGFALASKGADPRAIGPAELDRRVAARVNAELRYYQGEIHQGQFMLPRHIRQRLEHEPRVIEDDRPLFTYH